MDIEQAYKYMSFAQLRDYLKRLRFRQKMWFSIPVFVSVAAILLLSLSGWGTYPQAMSSHKLRFDISSFGIFDWIFTAAMVLFLPYEKTERKFNYSAAVLMAAFTAVKALFGILNPLNLAMAVYYYFAALMLLPINQQINFIKALPDYPFPEGVELERKREAEAQKFSENNIEMKRRMKLEQEKKANSMDELMQALPKKYIDPSKISRGEFDDTEEDYSDKLIGEDLRDGAPQPEFDEIDPEYKGKFRSESGLTMKRRNEIELIDEGFEGDFEVEPKPLSEEELPALTDGKVSLEKNDPPVTDDGVL